jgi:rubredoxin
MNRTKINKQANKFPKIRVADNRSKLKKELIRIFSLYIRERDGYKCVICGRTRESTVIQNGHLITCSSGSTQFDELNCHCQCRDCNYTHEYHPEIYTSWFIKKYSLEAYDMLCIKSRKSTKFKAADFKIMIELYKKKIKELKNGN